MPAISESAVWVKEPLPGVGVVIVTSAALPKYIIDRLHIAIDDWDQVAYLVVTSSHDFLLDWLLAESNPSASTLPHANKLLRSVSKGCYLLDIEDSPSPRLAWLGSVCGHKLRLLNLGHIEQSKVAMDKQVEDILAKVRTLAKRILEERCIIQ
jgi:hypothetical protein